MNKMKLSPPWVTYVNEIESLFKGDPDIKFQYNEEDYNLKIFVEDAEKADALMKLLPLQKEFGNVILNIEVIPADDEAVDYVALFRSAFKDNPNIADITTVDTPFGYSLNYVVFKKEVVQFFNDDTSDLNGVCSTLNENIARDVFGENCGNVYFCTDIK